VEDLGFDSIWLGEHLLWRVGFLDPLITMAAVAAATEKIMVGTSVLILPLHHPLRLAKAATTLDLLSNRRLILGVGLGGENPNEFAALGVDVNERGRLADEALGLMRRLWTEDSVHHNGPAYPCDDVTVRPRPVTPGGPPVWVGGRSTAAQRRAARLGDGWIPYLVSPRQYRQGLDYMKSLSHTVGHTPARFTPALHLFVAIDGNDSGHWLLGNFFERLYTDRLERVMDSTCLVGSVADCAKRLHEYWLAGARHFMLQIPVWGPDDIDRIEQIGNELLPLALGMIADGPLEVST
jgi:probable F420-dependent oxidoreductase